LGDPLPSTPIFLHIEAAATLDKPKLLSEDSALLFLHPTVNCLQIEGISGRYMIYACDVERIEARASGKSQAVLLDWRIGSTSLSIALKDQGVRSELQAQVLHRCALLRKINKTLARNQ